MSVEFKAKNRKLLEEAIRSLGWNVSINGEVFTIAGLGTIDLRTETASIPMGISLNRLNQLKQQYSKEALKRAAKLRGWQFKASTQTKGVLRK